MGEDIMDYTERCRLCIAGSKRLSIDIFSPEGKRSKLQSKISKYLSLKIAEDDKLPSSICYQCLFRLETWVSFKKHCLDSDQTLKNWAFFCGAITPDSYLNEANKSSENGSDVEKPSSAYFSSKDNDAGSRHRTPPKTAPGPSQTPPRTISPSPSAPLSSSSSSSSQRRGLEINEKPASKNEISPLNGVIEGATVRPSKSGRRKVLRPTKAFTTSRGDEHQVQLVTVKRKVSQASRKSEETNLPKELPQKQTSSNLTLPFKRKRGRPSKAWLRERAEALRKLKEAAQTQQELSPEKEQKEQEELRDIKNSENLKESKDLKIEIKKEPRDIESKELEESRDMKECREPKEKKEPKSSKSKGMTEMIELDDPDFGSMKFTLSVIDSSAVPYSEKNVIYPESGTSVSSGRLSSDSCLKEEFSGFPNVEMKRAQDEGALAKVVEDNATDRLSEPCVSEISDMPLSPQNSDRKRSHSALGHRSSEESEEKIKKLDVPCRSFESLKADDSTPIAVTALERASPDQFKTENDESDGEQVTGDETNLGEPCFQSDVEFKDDPPLEDDSDSDVNGPPMSPLSPARINFEVIELGEVQDTENDRSDDFEY